MEEIRIECSKPVHIGKRAWIGAGATILPGVTIGEYLTIILTAMTALVSMACSGTSKANEVTVGVPAKFIKNV